MVIRVGNVNVSGAVHRNPLDGAELRRDRRSAIAGIIGAGDGFHPVDGYRSGSRAESRGPYRGGK